MTNEEWRAANISKAVAVKAQAMADWFAKPKPEPKRDGVEPPCGIFTPVEDK